MAKPVKCPKCATRMSRTGFDMKEHGATEFHYMCERCGHTRTRTLNPDASTVPMLSAAGAS